MSLLRRIAAAALLPLALAAAAAPAAALPGAALPDAAPPAAAAAEGSGPAIAAERDAGSDARIAERLRGIFGELPAFRNVAVEVSEGVVTLRGKVAREGDSSRAEAIASRISGVAAVESQLERDVSLDENLGGLGGIRQWLDRIVAMLPLTAVALGLALAIAAVGYALAGLTGLWRRIAPNPFLADLVASAIRFVFVIGGLVVALNLLGAGALLGAVLGGAGVIGIALGFAMRDTIENYVASLMLSLRQPFRANDLVRIDACEGRVIRLTSRATILMTLDGNHLRIPNSTVFKAVILNYTRNPQRRFDFDLGIDADDDPDAARALGVETLAGLPFVLAQPEPMSWLMEVGESNIVLRFFGWIDQREHDFYKARSRAIAAVKRALEGAGFALPEPIYRLRFDPAALPSIGQDGSAAGTAPARPEPRPKPAPAATSAAAHDTSPEKEVARMVENERAGTPPQKDLLDSSRPVE